MRALVLHAVGDLRHEEVATPQPPPGWVRVRVHACGVCGSDLPRCFVKGTYRFPTIPGHEFAGTTEEGRRVAVLPLVWCDRCEACAQHRYAQCENYDYVGSRRDGAWAEEVVAPAKNLLEVPDGVHLDDASLTEPAAVALHALRRGSGVANGETVAIFGAGPIGMMAAWWARHLGGTVVLIDVADDKLRTAREEGFEHVLDARTTDPLAELERISPGGAHLSLEAAGVPATTLNSLRATRRSGRCVLMGNPEGGVHLPADLLSQAMRREIAIFGTWNSDYRPGAPDDDWHSVLAAMAHHGFRPSRFVSHRLDLAAAPEFLQAMFERRVSYGRVLIQPNPS